MRMFLNLFTLVFSLLLLSFQSIAKESAEFADKVINEHGVQGAAATTLKSLLMSNAATRNIGTEEPSALFGPNQAVHPASRQACIEKVIKTGLIQPNDEYKRICRAKWMSPIPHGQGGSIEGAKVCIDQFEFPNMPCEYPMVWAPASFAHKVCQSMGKRVCNSHEWEGACGGYIEQQDPYLFHLENLNQRRNTYNAGREKVWAFSFDPNLQGQSSKDLCAIYSPQDPDIDASLVGNLKEYYSSIGKSPTCHTPPSDYKNCGSHTWPAGMKYKCKSKYDVYDLHGNVAEVMNFPRSAEKIAAGTITDKTERKGSFFVPRPSYPDDCRVRQPYEHFKDFATDTHSFYQEGFRCCKDL